MLIVLWNPLLLSEFLEKQQKYNIVCEDDDLSLLRLLDQSARHSFPPPVVEGGHGVIEHNARWIVGGA